MIKDDITVFTVKEFNCLSKLTGGKTFEQPFGFVALCEGVAVYATTIKGAYYKMIGNNIC
jgi:hypothetical protein